MGDNYGPTLPYFGLMCESHDCFSEREDTGSRVRTKAAKAEGYEAGSEEPLVIDERWQGSQWGPVS